MPRPKLSSLSSLMPAKGEATRPEPVAVPEAMQAVVQASEHDRVQASKQAGTLLGHKDGSRSAVSFRMTEGIQERLRLYAFETRRSKQDILDDALHEYLERAGH